MDEQAGIKEWAMIYGSESLTEAPHASSGDINPFPTSRGNLHVEHGWESGDAYDAERLGLYINDNMLYVGLQTNYDLKNGLRYDAGDFMFQLYDSQEAAAANYSDINDNTEVALAFSFNNDNSVNLGFHYGDNMTFDTALYYQTGLAYRVSDSTQSAYDAVDLASLNNDAVFAKRMDDNYDYTLELVIDLTTIDKELQRLFADNTYAQMHWQMECGNDILYVADSYSFNQVPEPATFILFGLGLLGAGALGRKRQQKK
ncbi:MAG: PEP-CTERM sorting domain-containing protein [Desulfobacter sp.]|nr:MAG: PEP-CTERM sorting domain-containing protein [Desulfobacter sp.]